MLKKTELLLIILLSFHISTLYADMGMVTADDANVSEESQKAIIFHNLEEEVLILGTDIKGDKNSSILRFIPFPSEPTMKLAPSNAFSDIINLIQKHKLQFLSHSKGGESSGEDVEMKLNIKLGFHDLTLIKINSSDHFREWVNNFFKSKGLPTKENYPKIENIVDDYVQRGVDYFVFDLVKLDDTVHFINPIMYRFKSKKLYYPLKTSNTFGGEGKIDLILITPRTVCRPMNTYYNGCLNTPRMIATTSAKITTNEIKDIFPDSHNFFNTQNIFIQLLSYWGMYQFNHDIFVDITDRLPEAINSEDEIEYMNDPFSIPIEELLPIKPHGIK